MTHSTSLVLTVGVCVSLAACGPAESQAENTGRNITPPVPVATPAVPRASSPTPAPLSEWEEALLQSNLLTVRSQAELRTIMNGGTDPWFEQGASTPSWEWYPFDANFSEAPTNPLSPDAVATKVAHLTTAGATGMDVEPTVAGWAWNATDKKFYAAGYDY